MFGLFDKIEESISNALDVGIGIATLGELGDVSKDRISKLVADGIELYLIADMYDTTVDVIEEILEGDSSDE